MKLSWGILTVGCFLCLTVSSAKAQTLSADLKKEDPQKLARDVRAKGDPIRGAILFPQAKLGCAGCHAPGNPNLLGPDLTQLGKDATDLYLIEALLQPSKAIRKGYETVTLTTNAGKIHTGRIIAQNDDSITIRETPPSQKRLTIPKAQIDVQVINKKSSMPENQVDQLENRQQFLDVVRYVITLKESAGSPQPANTPSLGGGTISEEHQGLVLIDSFKCAACHKNDLVTTPIPPKQAPNLVWSAGHIDPNYLQNYIEEPHAIKPGTTMPHMLGNLSPDVRQQTAKAITHYLASRAKQPFQRQPLDSTAAKRGSELFHTIGCVACHSPRDENRVELLIKDSVPLGNISQKYNLNGLIAFLKNPHVARPSGRMPSLKLTHWEAIDLSNYLLSDPTIDAPASLFKLDETLAARGKEHYTKLGCVKCHEQQQSLLPTPSLASLNVDRGCLSGRQGNWPRYQFTGDERTAIRTALKRESESLTDEETISLALTTFNCVRCHQRNELGGVSADRDSYFHTANPNLGPQGRIPPTLTNVGAKLQPKWLRQVLVSGRTIRPYMKTRMPQCGTENIAFLVELLARTDSLPPVNFAKLPDVKEARNTGHQMVGNSGLNCVACHTFQQKPAATMPAVDLTEMGERLKKEWFYHYMLNPQRLSRNTVMPSFWPGGKAIRQDILSGEPYPQIEALWTYLQDGRQARVPSGLIRKPIELLATDEAVMLRRSWPGIGKRGIGVGYPQQVNLAFDAEQMRLAMVWQERFADPAGVWMSQGHGTARPLGTDLVRFAPGPELDDAKSPWKVDTGRPPDHQFKGYDLDKLQRPKFRYRFRDIAVTDYPVDVKASETEKAFLRRTLTFTAKQKHENIVFRIRSPQPVKELSPGTFRLDRKLIIRVDTNHKAEIESQQLQIPLPIDNGTTTLVLEYIWQEEK